MEHARLALYAYLGLRALFVLGGIILLTKREWLNGLGLIGVGMVYTPAILGLSFIGVVTNFWSFALLLTIMLAGTLLLGKYLERKFPKTPSKQLTT